MSTSQSKAKRADWPVRKYRLGEEPATDELAIYTAAERLEQVVFLTRQAWRKPVPTYQRNQMPGVVHRDKQFAA